MKNTHLNYQMCVHTIKALNFHQYVLDEKLIVLTIKGEIKHHEFHLSLYLAIAQNWNNDIVKGML